MKKGDLVIKELNDYKQNHVRSKTTLDRIKYRDNEIKTKRDLVHYHLKSHCLTKKSREKCTETWLDYNYDDYDDLGEPIYSNLNYIKYNSVDDYLIIFDKDNNIKIELIGDDLNEYTLRRYLIEYFGK